MFDFVREFPGYDKEVAVGRTVAGHNHLLFCVHVDRTFDGRDWCRSHGMELIDRVPNTTRTAWYEIWASEDNRLMTAFLI